MNPARMTGVAAVGFVGLGVMGGPMAGHLISSGHDLTVWNRSPEKSVPLKELGAKIAPNLESLASVSDVVVTCVGRTEDVAECLDGLLKGARPGTLFIDHSTVSPQGAIQLAAIVESRGSRFLDAPVTGGSMGAQKGQLTIFCGGDETDFERAKPIFGAYAKRAERVGPTGSGQMMKVANQIAVGGALLALCESLAFAKHAGLDLGQTHELLSGGAAGSWAFDNYGPKILVEDWTPGFSIKNQLKDFGYALEAAQAVGAKLPGTEVVDRLLAVMESQGFGEETTAALYRLLAAGDPSQ